MNVQDMVARVWDAQGGCNSCGWHSSLSEHMPFDEDDLVVARGRVTVWVPCLNEEGHPEEAHRGHLLDLGDVEEIFI